MKYTLHENGWTVLLGDFDFANATQAQANEIAKLISTNIAVVAQGPKVEAMTAEDEVRFCSMIGNMAEMKQNTTFGKSLAYGSDETLRKFHRVTGELNEEGHPGLFGHKEALEWHNNNPWDVTRKPIVWLRTIKGALGSRTSWTNHILAYEDMKKEDPEFVAELEAKKYRIVYGRHVSKVSHMFEYWHKQGFVDALEISYEKDALPLVFTNESGAKGFFCSFPSAYHIFGLTSEESFPILNKVWNFCMRDKYRYDHYWQDGQSEVIISEQWLSVHKRFDFDGMDNRVLRRGVFDYANTSWWPEVKDRFKNQMATALKENAEILSNKE